MEPEQEDRTERVKSPLRHLHDTSVTLEKFRIAVGNRVSALERGVDNAEQPVPTIYVKLLSQAERMEADIDAAIAHELEAWPIWNAWLCHVKGIGPSLGGQMLSLLLPPIPTKGPSSWFKAAGLAPELRPDGLYRLPRPRKLRCPKCESTTQRQKDGEKYCTECNYIFAPNEGKLDYHPWLRRCLHNVATSFVRTGGYYRAVYDRAKARFQALHSGDPAWPPHRIDDAARWNMTKLFLSHLWEQWCRIEGIAQRPSYVVEKLGHQEIPAPEWDGKHKI